MESPIKFRDLRHSDVFECFEIMCENYSEGRNSYWSNFFVKDLKGIVKKDEFYKGKGRVGTLYNKIIAFGCYSQSLISHNYYELFWINVKQDQQKKGFGKLLVNDLEEEICKDSNDKNPLVLFDTSTPLFYEKLGYKKIHKSGEHSLMVKSLGTDSD